MLLAAASQNGMTIVIVLIVVLRQDMCKHSNEKGILYAE
jgi:superfamily II DNA helicase RecQ